VNFYETYTQEKESLEMMIDDLNLKIGHFLKEKMKSDK